MFSYQVYSEEEALSARFHLLPEGEYRALITKSMDKRSASGNPMMDITVTAYDENGLEYDIRDFLVFTKSCMWKIVQFVKAADIYQEYEDEKLCSAIVVNKPIRVKIGIEDGNDIPQDKLGDRAFGAKYPPKNKIMEYLPPIDNVTVLDTRKSSSAYMVDDDIPF